MITYAEALALIQQRAPLLPTETLAAAQASGRFLAESLCSPVDLPGFDNSAMDGVALRCAAPALPAGHALEIAGMVSAGAAAPVGDGRAWQIMTGAAVPAGCDCVVPIEQLEVIERDGAGGLRRVRLRRAVSRGQHVRRAGEDVAKGAPVLDAGTRIDAAALMLCAALGLQSLPLRRRARIALLCTGAELVDQSSLALRPGQIRDCNGPYLSHALDRGLSEVIGLRRLPDRPADYARAVQQAQSAGAEVIISTGAVSMGELDFIPAALAELGAETIFHKLLIRPGKPLLFAMLPGGGLYFGLPGNPLAAAVGARFVVAAALRAMAGLAAERHPRLPLAHATRKKPGMRSFLKAQVQLDQAGQASVSLLPGQESFRIAPLLRANAWAILDETGDQCAQGELIEVAGLQGPLQICSD